MVKFNQIRRLSRALRKFKLLPRLFGMNVVPIVSLKLGVGFNSEARALNALLESLLTPADPAPCAPCVTSSLPATPVLSVPFPSYYAPSAPVLLLN